MKLFFKIICINLVILLLVFVFFEGVCRYMGIPYKVAYVPNENHFAHFDPERGWSYVPGISTIHATGDLMINVHFDENGIRIPYPDFRFDYSRPSVLFIGGSITMGHGLSYEESFVGKFGNFKEVPYQVVNLGVQGYGSDQALLTLKKYLPKFNTKIVVYDFTEDVIKRNGNYDRRMLIPTAKFLGTKPLFALDSNHKLYLSKKPLLYKDYMHSYLIDFLTIKIGSMLGAFPSFPEELTKELIQEMRRYSNEHGAYFVVINWRWTDMDYDRIFHSLDVEVIDTMKDAPEGWEKMVILEGSHPDAQASDHVANLLLDHFYLKGLLTKDYE